MWATTRLLLRLNFPSHGEVDVGNFTDADPARPPETTSPPPKRSSLLPRMRCRLPATSPGCCEVEMKMAPTIPRMPPRPCGQDLNKTCIALHSISVSRWRISASKSTWRSQMCFPQDSQEPFQVASDSLGTSRSLLGSVDVTASSFSVAPNTALPSVAGQKTLKKSCRRRGLELFPLLRGLCDGDQPSEQPRDLRSQCQRGSFGLLRRGFEPRDPQRCFQTKTSM